MELERSGFWKISLRDEYGNCVEVYEKSHFKAFEYVYQWFENSEERRERQLALNEALQWCSNREG